MLSFFIRQANQGLNIKLGLVEAFDAFGFEDDDFAAFGFTEVVGQPVNEQMVTGCIDQTHDWFAFFERLA